jgi:hypothetical protein
MHYPVVNKNGEIIASAVTNIDLHDISRASKTYGVKTFFVVTPLQDQKKLVKRIVSHWTKGAGSVYNPNRREALVQIGVKDSLEDVIHHIYQSEMVYPKTVVTCAKTHPGSLGYPTFRQMLQDGNPYLLLFGTAWGLSDHFISSADFILKPVRGITNYNHLSVRSAASIILDRLVGEDRINTD